LEIPKVDYKKVQLQLFTLEVAFRSTKDNYRLVYPRLNLFRDTRIIVFAKCINVINSTFFAVNALDKAASNEDWWNKMKSDFGAVQRIARFNRAVGLVQYDIFVRTAFAVQIFSSIESSLRDFVRALMPDLSPKDMNYV
jgi:hypothetical protein